LRHEEEMAQCKIIQVKKEAELKRLEEAIKKKEDEKLKNKDLQDCLKEIEKLTLEIDDYAV
jgi:hypothetical protein